MQMETLQKDMIAAMKAKDKVRKEAISSLVSAVKKNAIDAGCRDDIKEDLVESCTAMSRTACFPASFTFSPPTYCFQ